MNNKTKKSPTGAPLGNPLKFFREGGEKIKTMFKKGGYNTPTQSLPKKYNGGSGMGRMAADDAAYESMMGTPTQVPRDESMELYDLIRNDAGKFKKAGNTMESGDPFNMSFLEPKIKIQQRRAPGTMSETMGVQNPERTRYTTPEEKNGGMMKKGGATKATKFAALARPFNKATAADRIAGAKKNVRKKK
jgi:hypothetical protein